MTDSTNDPALAASAIEAGAEQLAAILNAADVAVYSKDLAGRYIWANKKALQVTGLALEEVVGKTDFQLMPREIAERFRQIDIQIIARQSERVTAENTVTMGDGSQRTFENITRPLKNADGELIGLVGTASDITQRKQLEAELRHQRRLFKTILDNVDSHIYMRDADHRFHYVNRATAALLGKSPDNIIGKLDEDLMDAATAEQIQQLDHRVFRTGKTQTGRDTFIDHLGKERHFWTVKVPFGNGDKEPKMLIGISSDITELHEAYEQMRELSLTDPLTSLRNRRDFHEQLGRELSRARRIGSPTALLLMDLDHFKSINDQYGHPVGDQVLIKVADLIGTVIRQEDIAGRLGGEEFGILMPGADIDSARRAAERLRIVLAEATHEAPDSEPFVVTVSIGIAVCEAQDTTSGELFIQADRCLYEAKRAGRNRVRA